MKNYCLLKVVILFCIAVFSFACNNNDDQSLDQNVTQKILEIKNSPEVISSEQAIEVASSFFKIQSGLSGLRSGEETRSNAFVEAIDGWFFDSQVLFPINRINLYVNP